MGELVELAELLDEPGAERADLENEAASVLFDASAEILFLLLVAGTVGYQHLGEVEAAVREVTVVSYSEGVRHLDHVLEGDSADLVRDHARNEVLVQPSNVLEHVPREGLILRHQNELVVVFKHFERLHDVLRLRRQVNPVVHYLVKLGISVLEEVLHLFVRNHLEHKLSLLRGGAQRDVLAQLGDVALDREDVHDLQVVTDLNRDLPVYCSSTSS